MDVLRSQRLTLAFFVVGSGRSDVSSCAADLGGRRAVVAMVFTPPFLLQTYSLNLSLAVAAGPSPNLHQVSSDSECNGVPKTDIKLCTHGANPVGRSVIAALRQVQCCAKMISIMSIS